MRNVRKSQNGSKVTDRFVLSIFVSCIRDETGDMVVRELQRLRGAVDFTWPPPDRFPGDVDLIVADLVDHMADRLPWVPGEATAALLVMLPAQETYDRREVTNCSPDAVVPRPFAAHAFRAAVDVARNQFHYIHRLRSRIARLDENLRASRDIERAKAIVKTLRGMDDNEAYAFIRHQAMERRVTVAAYASAIIDSHDMLN